MVQVLGRRVDSLGFRMYGLEFTSRRPARSSGVIKAASEALACVSDADTVTGGASTRLPPASLTCG